MPNPKEKAPLSSTPKAQTSVENSPQASASSRQGVTPITSSSDTTGNQSSSQRGSRQENAATRTPTYEEIQMAAYQLYLERGALEGFADEDWLQAERELIEGQQAQQKARAKGA